MSEFDFIDKYLKPLSNNTKESLNLKDDAAFIENNSDYNTLISTDTCVEGTHFFKETSPSDIANRLMGSSLSDIAAMGASPTYFMLNITFKEPPSDDFLKKFTGSIALWCKKYSISLIGGDTTMGGNSLVLSSTVFGKIPKNIKPTLRSNAKEGDILYVSGKLGGGLAGMWALEKEFKINTNQFLDILNNDDINLIKQVYNNPFPRFDLIEYVRKANSCIDISDGLIAEASHIAKSSSLDIIIELENIPFLPPVNKLIKENPNMIYDFLAGGDEYQLLLSAPADIKMPQDFTKIGKIVKGNGNVSVLHKNKKLEIKTQGFQHF